MDARETTRRTETADHVRGIRAPNAPAEALPAPKARAIIERQPLDSDLFASRKHVPDAFESRCGAMGQISEPVN